MRVLIDTNIMLDALIGRQLYYDFTDAIIKNAKCCLANWVGYIVVNF